MSLPSFSEEDRKQIELMRRRVENWGVVYRDRRAKGVSITYVAIMALKAAYYDPNKDPLKDTMRPSDYDPYSDIADPRDADLINAVWSEMAYPEEASLRIGQNGLTIYMAKLILSAMAFAGRRQRSRLRAAMRMPYGLFRTQEDLALLFFAGRVALAEQELKA